MSKNENIQANAGGPAANQSPAPEENAGGGVEMNERADSGETLDEAEIADLKAKAAKADENWDKYLRLSADFENYKKRMARERQDAVKYANESLVESLLPIVDNFEAALAATNTPQAGNVDALKTGITMIYSQLKSFLNESGAEEIDALNKPFDPNLHEAVSQQVSQDVPEGHVMQQMRKGYRFRDRLIRPAMVVVAKQS